MFTRWFGLCNFQLFYFSLLFCLYFPLSFQTREANRRGDQIDAERSSRATLKLNHWSVGLGVVSNILFIIIILYVIVESEDDP